MSNIKLNYLEKTLNIALLYANFIKTLYDFTEDKWLAKMRKISKCELLSLPTEVTTSTFEYFGAKF